MSFGFSPSDAITICSIAAKAYRGWNSACGEYSDITLSLNEIRILLERIKDESQSDGSVLVRSARDATRLKGILAGVRRCVEELTTIIDRFKSLGQDRSRESNWRKLEKNWDRYRFGSANISSVRLTLSQHVSAITAYLEAVGLSSLSRIEQDLHALPELMQKSMNTLAAEIRAGRREGSIMTAYEGDDSELWRQFRREFISDGIKGSDIHKFKPRIRRCLQHWMEEGLLEEEEPLAQIPEDSHGDERLSDNSDEVGDNGMDGMASTQQIGARGIRRTAVVTEHSSSTRLWRVTKDGTIFPPDDKTITNAATPHKSGLQVRSGGIVLSHAGAVEDYGTSPENIDCEDSDDDSANDTFYECVEGDVDRADGEEALRLRFNKAKKSKENERSNREERSRWADQERRKERERKSAFVFEQSPTSDSDEYERARRQRREENDLQKARAAMYEEMRRRKDMAAIASVLGDERANKYFSQDLNARAYIASIP